MVAYFKDSVTLLETINNQFQFLDISTQLYDTLSFNNYLVPFD